MYSRLASVSCSESGAASLNNSSWPLVYDTTELVHVQPITAILGSMVQCLSPLPASSPVLPLWTTLTKCLQQLGMLQSLLGSREARQRSQESSFPAKRSMAVPAGCGARQKDASAAGLGTGCLRRTGDSDAQEALHAYALHRCVAHSGHTAFILLGEVFYQSCFILQKALLCKHPCTQEKKIWGNQVTFSFATYLKLSKTWGWASENPQSGHRQNVGHFLERAPCGMSFIPRRSLSQQSCQLANTVQINTLQPQKIASHTNPISIVFFFKMTVYALQVITKSSGCKSNARTR